LKKVRQLVVNVIINVNPVVGRVIHVYYVQMKIEILIIVVSVWIHFIMMVQILYVKNVNFLVIIAKVKKYVSHVQMKIDHCHYVIVFKDISIIL